MGKMSKVTILGGGSFGVALAKLASEKSDAVSLWVRDSQVCQSINDDRHHPHRLPQVFLPANIIADSDLKKSLTDANVIILALPMAALSSVLTSARAWLPKDAIIVSTAKGILEDGLLLPHEVLERHVPELMAINACFLSGPSFAVELAMGLPTALTIASRNKDAALYVQANFSRPSCRLYRSDDVVGVCVGGALKNVIAIAAGAALSLGLGRNALAALITRGLAEMTRLAVAMGGKLSTLSGLCGVGDLILSCTDDMSRNHRLGTMIADGQSLDVALTKIGSVVEGAKTAKAIPQLAAKFGIDMPISLAVFQVLYEGLSAETALSSLLSRKLKDED